jgi:hypothetical protein
LHRWFISFLSSKQESQATERTVLQNQEKLMRSSSTLLLGSLLAATLLAGMAPGRALARTPPPPGATSAAKGAHSGEPEILQRFQAAVPKLGLWPEQKPRITKLVAEVKASLKKIEAGPGTPQQKEIQRQALHQKAQDGLDHILTVAQAAKLKQLMGGAAKPKK